MYDPRHVISQLMIRWEQSYGETIGVEEIRRHLSRLLDEAQKRELDAVFSSWSGKQLKEALDATFDLSDEKPVVAEIATSEPSMSPFQVSYAKEVYTPKKPKGRPKGSKNKS